MQIIYLFDAPWTSGPIIPKVTISFGTAKGLSCFNMNSQCECTPGSPSVSVSVTTIGG